MIASLNFAQHLLDIRGREGVLRAAPKRLQLCRGVMDGPAYTCLAKGSSDPFADRYTLALREPLQVVHLLIRDKDLKSFAHTSSITHSLSEIVFHAVPKHLIKNGFRGMVISNDWMRVLPVIPSPVRPSPCSLPRRPREQRPRSASGPSRRVSGAS